MKVNWAAVAVLGSFALWGLSIEYRLGTYQSTLDVSARVQTLEDLLMPVIVDHRVEQQLRELREVPRVYGEPPEPTFAPPEEELRVEAQEWAQKQFKR